MEAQREDELFDVVDADDQVVGQSTRKEVHEQGLLHRAVHVFVWNGDGGVVLQKRSRWKDTSPGKLTSACSGHVDAGESYEAAMRRELIEELGLPVQSGAAAKLLFKHSACEQTGQEFVHVYGLDYAGNFQPNPAEVESLEQFGQEELDHLIKTEPERFAGSFRFLWEHWRGQQK